MNKYEMKKELARNEAIEWQHDFSNNNYSYYDLMLYEEYFYNKAKRYGLIKEFRANGII